MNRKSTKVLSVFISMLVFFTVFSIKPVTIGSVQAADEFDMLRTRYFNFLTGGNTYDPSDQVLASKIALITEEANSYWSSLITASGRTYLWSDMQFSSDKYVNDKFTQDSYARLMTMATAYHTKGSSLQGNTDLKNDIVSAMDWLYTNRYNENSPTYDQEGGHRFKKRMGIPHKLVKCVTLMYDDLTSTQVSNYMKAVDHFSPEVGDFQKGANRIFKGTNIIIRGILGKNSNKIIQARDDVAEVYQYVTSGDGMYKDGSFIHHKAVAYTGLYGRGLLRDCVIIDYLLSGSSWAVNDPAARNVYKWVYDAFEPIVYKGFIFDDSRGRSAATSYPREYVEIQLISAIAILSRIPGSHQERLQSMAKFMIENTPTDFFTSQFTSITENIWANEILNDSTISSRGELSIYKQYPCMDFVVQQRPEYAVGISMHSTRMMNYEQGNTENLKGWHQGDGWMQLLNSDRDSFGDQYWPTIDSYRLPGTTVNQNTTYNANTKSYKNWVGGTDVNHLYGVTGMELNPKGQTLNAKKSWFMFDNEIVCLGSGISAYDNKVVETIVENKMVGDAGDNELTVDGTSKSTNLNWSETMNNVNWAHITGHTSGGDTGYYFPEGASVKGLSEARSGSWYDLGTGHGTDTTIYTRNYLTLWLDHGMNPTSETYQYALLPGMDALQVQNYASSPEFSVITNTASVQAVKENSLNVVAANFWYDGTSTADIITADKKASIITQETTDYIDISVADPTQSNSGVINVEIDKAGYGVFGYDEGVTVKQLSPSIKLAINVNGSLGKTFRARITLTDSAEMDYQAEDYTSQSDCTVDVAGHMDYDGVDSYVEWDNVVKGDGLRTIELRYANGSGEDSQLQMTVNNEIVGDVVLPATDSWSTWSTVTIDNVLLKSGSNTIRLTQNVSNGDIHLDKLIVQPKIQEAIPQATINDNDSGISYVGAWGYSKNRPYGDYKSDVTYTRNNEDYFEFTFTGTGIEYITEMNTDMGNVDIYIDGVFQETVSCYNSSRLAMETVYSSLNLSQGTHTIKGIKKSGQYMLVDAIKVY